MLSYVLSLSDLSERNTMPAQMIGHMSAESWDSLHKALTAPVKEFETDAWYAHATALVGIILFGVAVAIAMVENSSGQAAQDTGLTPMLLISIALGIIGWVALLVGVVKKAMAARKLRARLTQICSRISSTHASLTLDLTWARGQQLPSINVSLGPNQPSDHVPAGGRAAMQQPFVTGQPGSQ